MKKKIYISGNMTPDHQIYYSWADKFRDALSSFDNLYELSISHLKDDSKFIVRHDLSRISRCDLIVVNLGVSEESHHLTGAIVEIYEAYRQMKPVYAFVSDDLIRSQQANSPWVQEFITKEFSSEEELVSFLIFSDNL